jgi:glycosyltransferase involved in cell wall biosynthesis
MSENISKHFKLLVISDTGMYQRNNQWYAFGPVVTEITYFLSVFSEVTWIGFNREDQVGNESYKVVDTEKIYIIPLKRVGGPSLMDKLTILANYPSMWSIICNEVKKHNHIHVRAPSNPAIIAMQLSKKYPQKKFWFKYAGSWVDGTSKSYNWQRNRLKKLKSNGMVTVNGHWDNQPNNILAFDNPCLDSKDRSMGETTINQKVVDGKYSICFVGGLNYNKGIQNLFAALKLIDNEMYDSIHIVGDGPLNETLTEESKSNKIIFHGYMSKEKVASIYQKSHFIVLPSKSEGFPKVISEAMNYGCIPIVSNVSCISQVVNNKNGFLLNSLHEAKISQVIIKALSIKKDDFYNIVKENYRLAGRYTYKIYIERVKKEIFDL